MEKIYFCGSLWALLEYFRDKKLPTAHCFNIGAHIGICAQISRNTLLYLPSLEKGFPDFAAHVDCSLIDSFKSIQ